MTETQKRLLVLGGSRISCEIVRKAQEMGVYTMVTDWYPKEKSPAKKIADKSFMTSTADIAAMVDLIKKEKVDGVITGYTDSVLPHYANMCEQAGLPCYGTKKQFEILTNKKDYKKLCEEFGVPIVNEYHIEGDIDSAILNHIKYPVLVKPSDNSGARGISICNNEAELIAGYKKALDFSERKEILIERYINGEEVTIFYTLQDGEIYLSGMGNRHIKHSQDNVIALPVAYTFPSIHLKKYINTTDSKVKEMFKSLGLKNGMVFIQCLVEDGECIIYDIGYRLTGTLEYKLLDEICHYNPLEMMIKFALSGKKTEPFLHKKADPYWNKYACNVSFLIKPGKIDKIQGLEEVKRIPEVLDVVLAHTEGEELLESSKGTLKQIMLRVFATANNKKELEHLLNSIYNTLKVTSVDGESMLLEGFDTQELGEDVLI
ncbi:ATP-grasp domain-containing protein [Salipaludibacillus sp. CUR1]|uniref:ATP-binding protein n=1 Tax=Salipaludibacillus sp. CUR1 TaxID=2820003 RepID=UPI001E3E900B|nr:ATP-grasp domain-containing protein [Salipaludibacillus sp. CUR1]MCE7791183.1 ATP-grasp domain-containing protein [Salipaludibacillus sp. CUR1]